MSPRPGTRTHVHEEAFAASPERLFSILHTPSAIRRWWGATRAIVIPREGGLWAAIWGEEDDPDHITTAIMTVFDPPRRIVLSNYSYVAKKGPLPFAVDFETEFTIRVAKDRSTILRVAQSGFPLETGADEFYAACDRGWRDTFAGIRKYLGNGDD